MFAIHPGFVRAPAASGTLLVDQLTLAPVFAGSTARKLRSAYGSGAFVVTPSSGSPASVGFTGANKTDMTALASAGGSSASITTWKDQSASGIGDLTSTSGPAIITGGTIQTLNGNGNQTADGVTPAMAFNGSANWLTKSIASALGGITNTFQFAAVADLANASNRFGRLLSYLGTSQTYDYNNWASFECDYDYQSGGWNFGSNTARTGNPSGTPYFNPAGKVLILGVLNPSSTTLTIRGFGADYTATAGANSTALAGGVLAIGSDASLAEQWAGRIAEIIIQPGNNSADLALMKSDMMTAYDIS